MRMKVAMGLIVGGLMGLAGCAADRASDLKSFGLMDHSPTTTMAMQHPPRSQPSAMDVEIPDTATVEDYVNLALERNPTIFAAQRGVEIAESRIAQVSSLDDPMLQVAPIGEMAETAAGEVGVMTGISQKIPFPGKRSTAGNIARVGVAHATAQMEQIRLDVITDVRKAYWSHYFSARAIEVTQQTRELLRQFREVADSRFRAGTANQSDVLRASVELSDLDNQLITLEQTRATAAALLNSLMDRPVTAPLPTPKAVEPTTVELNLDDLLAQAAESSPELHKIYHRLDTEQLRAKLARLQYFPDLTISANYNFVDDAGLSPVASGKDQWWVGFGINLPIWTDKYRAAEREAAKGRAQALAELSAMQNRIAFGVQDALVKVQTAQRQVQLFRDVILPQARQTVDASSAGYQAGRVDFLTLVDNWRKLLSFELMYHQNQAQLQKDLAELERLVGVPVNQIDGVMP